MIIAITLHNGRAKCNPATYLGKPLFERYRIVCEAVGVLFDREIKAQMAELEAVPKLLEALKTAHFEPRLHPLLSEALAAREKAASEALGSASERLEAVKESLNAAGLALFPYQEIGVKWLAPRRSGLLCDEPGLGKTIQGLVAAPAGPVLVVAPAVAKGVWQRESLRWRPDLRPIILKGRGSFRWPQHGEIIILNFDILPALEEANEEGDLIKLKPFDGCPSGITVIVDECHNVKSPKTLRTKRLRKLLKECWSAGGRAFALTGTPLLNRPEELASLLQTFGLFSECFGSWTRYLRIMNGQKKYWGGFEWGKPTPAAIEGIKRVMLRRLRADVLPELPDKTYEPIAVEIDAATQKACDEAAAALQANGVSLEQAIFEAKSLGSAFEVVAKARKALATAKLPALLEILEEYEEANEPVLVFSAHRPPIDALATRRGWATITGDTPPEKRTELENLFQAGHLKGIGATIQAGGTALTLTRAHQVIFIDAAWTPALNSQAEDRVCRIGQTRGVIIKQLYAPGTIDEDVIALLRSKQEIIARTIDAAADGYGI